MTAAGLAQQRDQGGEVAWVVELDLETQSLGDRRRGVAGADVVARVDPFDAGVAQGGGEIGGALGAFRRKLGIGAGVDLLGMADQENDERLGRNEPI